MKCSTKVPGRGGADACALTAIGTRCAWFLLTTAVLVGCRGATNEVPTEDPSVQRLQRIGAAYTQAGIQLGRPPRDANDLTAALQSGPDQPDAADTLRSPHDGEPYVIVWNVDFKQLAMTRGNVDVVLAYEAKGKDGRRHVLKPPAQVLLLTEEQFQAAQFPPGHTPAP